VPPELLQSLVDSMGDAVLAIDRERRFLIINEAARKLLEFEAKAGDLLADTWSSAHAVVGENGKPIAYEDTAFARGLRGLATDGLVFSWPRRVDEPPVWVEVCARPLTDPAGNVIAVIAAYRDVTSVRAMTRALARSEQLLRAVLANLPNGATFLVDRDLRYVAADGPALPAALRRVGASRVIGRTVADLSPPEFRASNEQLFERTLAGESVRVQIRRGDTAYELSTVPIGDGERVTHALLFVYDVTERERDRALLEATLAHIHDGVVLLDDDRRILLSNHAYRTMFGVTEAQIGSLTREEFIDRVAALAADPAEFRAQITRATDAPIDVELVRPFRRILRRTGTSLDIAGHSRYLVTWHDVTAQVDQLREREQLTLLDALTGIANRRHANQTLARELDRARRNQTALSVALLDIDHFKKVNDDHGHNAGDEVLRNVAGVLTAAARGSDLIARWGGEEFVAIVPADISGARIFCERARTAVETFVDGQLPKVTISVGVTEVVSGDDADQAISRADALLYEAKRRGRNRVVG